MMIDLDKTYQSTCKAQGCPLPATKVTDRYDPEGKNKVGKPKWGICEYHAVSKNWTATTERVLNNKKILQIIHALKSIDDLDIKPKTGERLYDWIVRVEHYLHGNILNIHKAKPTSDEFDDMRKTLKQNTGGVFRAQG